MSRADDLVAATRGWLRTPYRHHARVKGAGVDCIQLLIAAHEEAGLVGNIDTGTYSTDWFLHRNEDVYLEGLCNYLVPLDDSMRPISARLAEDPNWSMPVGSVFVLRIGRTFSHGGIISKWPFVIHASQPAGIVEETDILRMPGLTRRDFRAFIHPELKS